ncbi:hypothetical protein L9F63_016706, partial [Diploptera punctata]
KSSYLLSICCNHSFIFMSLCPSIVSLSSSVSPLLFISISLFFHLSHIPCELQFSNYFSPFAMIFTFLTPNVARKFSSHALMVFSSGAFPPYSLRKQFVLVAEESTFCF